MNTAGWLMMILVHHALRCGPAQLHQPESSNLHLSRTPKTKLKSSNTLAIKLARVMEHFCSFSDPKYIRVRGLHNKIPRGPLNTLLHRPHAMIEATELFTLVDQQDQAHVGKLATFRRLHCEAFCASETAKRKPEMMHGGGGTSVMETCGRRKLKDA